MDLGEISECAPNIDGSAGVCMTPTAIKHVAQKVSKKTQQFGSSLTPSEIIKVAKEVTKCGTESCVVRKVLPSNVASAELQERFKPHGPRYGEQLLDNFNIDQVLQQYKKKFPDFHHVEFQMIDFNEKGTALSDINLPDCITKGIKYVGCIVNTDISAPGHHGIHWFAIFIDLSRTGTTRDPFTIEYFNSSGRQPMEEIQIWAHRKIQELELSMRNSHCEFVTSTRIRQQNDKHSCGPYSLYYIISRLEGTPWRWFGLNYITDAKMHEFRKHLFRETE